MQCEHQTCSKLYHYFLLVIKSEISLQILSKAEKFKKYLQKPSIHREPHPKTFHRFLNGSWTLMSQLGMTMLGGRRGTYPFALFHGVQERQELPSMLSYFHLSCLVKEAFYRIGNNARTSVWFKKFFWRETARPPT